MGGHVFKQLNFVFVYSEEALPILVAYHEPQLNKMYYFIVLRSSCLSVNTINYFFLFMFI